MNALHNHTLINEILMRLGHLEKGTSGFRKRNCMMCTHRGETPDKRKRFGIKTDNSITIKCFNCGFTAYWEPGRRLSKPLKKFMRVVGFTDLEIKKLEFNFLKEKGQKPKTEFVLKNDWDEITDHGFKTFGQLIDEHCNNKHFLKAVQYSIDRRFYSNDLMWKDDTVNRQRVTIPYWHKGKLIGWTGRAINDTMPLKYINHEGKQFVLNIDKQTSDTVLLFEGVIEAYMFDGMSCFGNSPCPNQIALIKSLNKDVVLCPDRDKGGKELIALAAHEGWNVSFPNWGDGIKDAAQAVEKYGKIATMQSIMENIETNPLTIKLKLKMLPY